jgi:hypothetical protein
MRAFFHGHRFAGERGLLYMQGIGFDQPRVGRHQITRAQADYIARYQRGSRQFSPRTVAQNGGSQRNPSAQSLDCALRAEGLKEVQRDTQDDHCDDNGGVQYLTQDRRNDAGDE